MSYSPSSEVVAAHGIPHLDTSLSIVSNDFETTQDYVISLIVFPVICAAIGLFCLLFFHFIYCCCCCCKNRRNKDENVDEEVKMARIEIENLNRKYTIITFFLTLLAVIICDSLFLSYNSNFTTGVETMGGAFDDLSNTTQVLVNATSDISYSAGLISDSISAANSASCPTTSSGVTVSLDGLESAAASLYDILDPLPGAIDDGKDSMNLYLIDYKDDFIFTGFSIMLCVVIGYFLAYFMKSRFIFGVWGGITGLFVFVMIIACTLLMIFVVSIYIIYYVIFLNLFIII